MAIAGVIYMHMMKENMQVGILVFIGNPTWSVSIMSAILALLIYEKSNLLACPCY
jgi:hypothetical protein